MEIPKFKSEAQRQAYWKKQRLIELQLDDKNEDKISKAYHDVDFGVIPMPKDTRSIKEIEQDTTLQMNLARKNAMILMKDDGYEAQELLDLIGRRHYNIFNRYAADIINKLRGQIGKMKAMEAYSDIDEFLTVQTNPQRRTPPSAAQLTRLIDAISSRLDTTNAMVYDIIQKFTAYQAVLSMGPVAPRSIIPVDDDEMEDAIGELLDDDNSEEGMMSVISHISDPITLESLESLADDISEYMADGAEEEEEEEEEDEEGEGQPPPNSAYDEDEDEDEDEGQPPPNSAQNEDEDEDEDEGPPPLEAAYDEEEEEKQEPLPQKPRMGAARFLRRRVINSSDKEEEEEEEEEVTTKKKLKPSKHKSPSGILNDFGDEYEEEEDDEEDDEEDTIIPEYSKPYDDSDDEVDVADLPWAKETEDYAQFEGDIAVMKDYYRDIQAHATNPAAVWNTEYGIKMRGLLGLINVTLGSNAKPESIRRAYEIRQSQILDFLDNVGPSGVYRGGLDDQTTTWLNGLSNRLKTFEYIEFDPNVPDEEKGKVKDRARRPANMMANAELYLEYYDTLKDEIAEFTKDMTKTHGGKKTAPKVGSGTESYYQYKALQTIATGDASRKDPKINYLTLKTILNRPIYRLTAERIRQMMVETGYDKQSLNPSKSGSGFRRSRKWRR